ncbi:hypothetical protein WMY93_004066 [Mugilogobius chulae]|uniref:Uncharacterized protein n=1 Tax=Mugilogobius chulae TaxID=88201 RepID=A0AAW0Q2H4_9GOBI
MSTISEQINTLEQRVSSNEDSVEDLIKRIKLLEKDNANLKDKVDDAENRSRSCNLRFINIPEKSEGRDVIAFMNQLIHSSWTKTTFRRLFPLRGHIDLQLPGLGIQLASHGRSWSSFLACRTRSVYYYLAKVKKELLFHEARVHNFPDFSAELTKRRREFDTVKKTLREMDVNYSMVYPCTLRIDEDGKSRSFRCPADAEQFIRWNETLSSKE